MIYAEYVQRLDYLPFPLDDLEKRLNSRPIKRWAYLVHDMDSYEDGTPKPPHLHVEMELNSSQKIDVVASWFDDKPERIEKGKSKSKKFMYENMLGYLDHEIESAQADEKYLYPRELVKANFDYSAVLDEAQKGIKEARERKREIPIQPVLDKICNNEIPHTRLDEHLSYAERIKYSRQIKEAYNIRDEKLALETERTMNVMYFYGAAGTGKTTWAKEYARKKNYTVFVSGSSNDPLQGYIGQECVIIDDIRGSDWKINDLLKLLDNHTISMVKARYSNKYMNDCKLMILTSVESIEDLYKGLKESQSEPIEQLKRRCTDILQFDERFIMAYHYSEGEREYQFVERVPNPTKFMTFAQQNTSLVNDVLDYMKESLNETGGNSQIDFDELKDDVMNFGKPVIASNDKDLPFE